MTPEQQAARDAAAKSYFEFNEWKEDAFRAIEVQACGKTDTIQLCFVDCTGDFHGEVPCPVALPLDDAEEMAQWITAQISAIRALRTTPPPAAPEITQEQAREMVSVLRAYDAYMIEVGYGDPDAPHIHPKAADNLRRVRAALAGVPRT